MQEGLAVYLSMRYLQLSVILLCSLCLQAQPSALKRPKQDTLLESILRSHPAFADIMQHRNDWNVQIVYTEINRNKRNKPIFTDHSFNLQPGAYFYPASTVKMPIAFLALEKLNELNIPGLDMHTTMLTDSATAKQDHVYHHPLAGDGRPTIAHYIKQIFLVSDNDAYNRLYEFLGQEYIQRKLKEKGYPDAVIRHRLSVSLTDQQNRQTNPIRFIDSTGKTIYEQPAQNNTNALPNLNVFQGKGYMRGSKLINEPFNFSEKNRVYLQDLHNMLKAVMFPESVSAKQRFKLTQTDLNFLRRWMSSYPSESKYPEYPANEYWPSYVKFLYYGSEKQSPIQQHIRIFNKVGDAYGYLTDIAYFADFQNNIEFILSATVYCNSDGIFNDDHYDYDKIGFPFMRDLGKAVYQHALKRVKKHTPNLKNFVYTYQRD